MHIHTLVSRGLQVPLGGTGVASSVGVLGGERAGLGGASLATIGSSGSVSNAVAPTSLAATARLRRSGPSEKVWGAL